MTDWLHFPFRLSCTGEGNGNPLQYCCLENPMDRRAWWAAVYGVTQSQIQLKQLNSSSSSRLYHPHFTEERTEAPRCYMTELQRRKASTTGQWSLALRNLTETKWCDPENRMTRLNLDQTTGATELDCLKSLINNYNNKNNHDNSAIHWGIATVQTL